ncbi:MAG: nicotinate-nucleotide adenylyltransferase [Thermodesulfobacteriota bacterium]
MTDRFGSRRRVGIFGGTFDPIHLGHLRAAEETRESFRLDVVLFIPSATPPHREIHTVTPAEHRLEMVRRAVGDTPAFRPSDLECRRSGASYSVETLRLLREEEGEEADFYFVLGQDAFAEIETWRRYEELFELSHWVVLQRPGATAWGRGAIPGSVRSSFHYERSLGGYAHTSGHLLFFRRFRCLEISGTEIRHLVSRGRSIRYLVPPKVEEYIWQNRLYTASGGEVR